MAAIDTVPDKEKPAGIELRDGTNWLLNEPKSFPLGTVTAQEAMRFASDPLNREPGRAYTAPADAQLIVPGNLIPVLFEPEFSRVMPPGFVLRSEKIGFLKAWLPGELIEVACVPTAIRTLRGKTRIDFVFNTRTIRKGEVVILNQAEFHIYYSSDAL